MSSSALCSLFQPPIGLHGVHYSSRDTWHSSCQGWFLDRPVLGTECAVISIKGAQPACMSLLAPSIAALLWELSRNPGRLLPSLTQSTLIGAAAFGEAASSYKYLLSTYAACLHTLQKFTSSPSLIQRILNIGKWKHIKTLQRVLRGPVPIKNRCRQIWFPLVRAKKAARRFICVCHWLYFLVALLVSSLHEFSSKGVYCIEYSV